MIRAIRFLPSLFTLLVLASCASTGRRVAQRDRFPLDPREGLTGPFSQGIEKGWEALLAGDAERAAAAFASARSNAPRLAAEIGWIEAMVLGGREKEALTRCQKVLGEGEPTVPLLVACGEARGRGGEAVGGFELYEQALSRAPERLGLKQRAEQLRIAARDALLEAARADAKGGEWKSAQSQILRAIEIAPDSASVRIVAGDIESAAGHRPKALERYREALELEPQNQAALEKAGDLALALSENALAVSLLDELARLDGRFAPRAEEARQAFRVSNWPTAEREAARSRRTTRAGAATLVWWMFPEVREARVNAGVIASDVVSRRDSRAVMRALALGLLEVNREKHRADPDASLTFAAGSRLLLRLLDMILPPNQRPPCLETWARIPRSGAEATRLAQECGLLVEAERPGISGPIFVRSLDRVRALASSVEARHD